ncbi:glycosyltransferase family 2 protein [Methanobrevibacter sp.]
MVKISIIMPVYNAGEIIKKPIESISRQTLNDLELICVDDGSTDDSLNVLNELKKSYPFINIIEQNNQGPGKARNTGLENAKGEYIGFLDADDIFIDENALEEMCRIADENDANIVSANLKFVDLDFNVEDNPHYENGDYAECKDYGEIEPKDYGIPYAFYKNIYKRGFLNDFEIKFPDLMRGQDPIFMAKVLVNTPVIYTVPLSLYGYNHAIGGGVNVKINNYDKKRDYIQHFKDTVEVLEEGGLNSQAEFYKIHLFRFLTWADNNHDFELFEIFNEVWGLDNKTFDESDFNYTRFIVPAKFYFINKYDSEEFFLKVNTDFLKINIYNTFAIDEKVMNDYLLVVYSYSFDDFKSNCAKFSNNNLKFKKEFTEFKIKKFIFNLNINPNSVTHNNAKLAISTSDIWRGDTFSKNLLKQCYMIMYVL